ncbi:rRNA-processing protein [Exophiala xenobiotica]|nr:rRNA-processing protein [Exophiala xenobiotica]
MSMTLATTWVRRGVAAQFPTKYQVDEAELDRISKLARLQLEDAQEDLENAQNPKRDDEESEDTESDNGVSTAEAVKANGAAAEGTDDLREYNLDDYDDDDDAPQQSEKFAMFGNVGSLAYHAPHEEDPYLVLPEGEQDSEDEIEELQILPSDNLILAAKVEDEVAHLEVFVYEDEADNLYIHHDIMLPAIPLCVEWINVPVGKEAEKRTEGNFVAVGTMSPEIEVWDLDVVDSMYPNAILGQEPDATAEGETNDESSTKKKSSKKKKKKPKANDDYHVDAVLALAANRQHRNLLASASADKTVKLWDLTTDWHPTESTVLLSGSYDRTVIATDMRAPDAVAPKWVVEADVEKVRWDIHDPNFFFVTTEIGTVHYFDARVVPTSHDKPSKPVWTLHAHDGAVSAFDISPSVPGLLATGSEDKRVKLWNIENNIPSMVVARNLDVGRIFSVQFAPDPDVAFRLSVAGSRGQLQVWDISTNPSVRKVFAHKVKLPETDGKERFVALPDDGTDDDEEEDGGMEAGGQEGWESMDED